MSIKFIEGDESPAKILVIGVGGCGGNIIRYLQQRNVCGIDYAAINTDAQALLSIENAQCINIGENITRGLGAGANPDLAMQAAEEEKGRLTELVSGYDMVFVAAGMGKGTGTGASPTVARLAKKQDALTVAVATLPFRQERRDSIAFLGMEKLAQEVDSLLVVPNAKLHEVLGDDITIKEALAAANDVLYNAVCGISEIITKHGEMNLDFNDVRAVMSAKGKAVMGSACKSGGDRAKDAAYEALCCPIMEDIDLSAASHFLINITASPDNLKLSETDAVHEVIEEKAPHCKNERFLGIVYDESMQDSIRVTIIATGISDLAVLSESLVARGGSTTPSLEVVKSGVTDKCFVSGRERQKAQEMSEKFQGDELRMPTIARRQRN